MRHATHLGPEARQANVARHWQEARRRVCDRQGVSNGRQASHTDTSTLSVATML